MIGIGADQHSTWFGGALQTSGYVRGIAHCCVFGSDLVPYSSEHREPRIDSDTHLEVDPVVPLDLLSVFACGSLDIQTRTYSAFRVVLVCDRRVEEGERTVHDLGDLLGVEPLAEPG